MRLPNRSLCVAFVLIFALPLAARAQVPLDPRTAGVEAGAAALEMHTAVQQTLAGTPVGDALIRDLQSLRTAVDELILRLEGVGLENAAEA